MHTTRMGLMWLTISLALAAVDLRGVQGACWDDGLSSVRCACRIWYLPPSSSGTGPGDSDYIGFRVAR